MTNAIHKPTREEISQSRWTWDRLRQSDRRILAVKAGLPSHTWWHDTPWDCLTEQQQSALMQFSWDKAFLAA